MPAGNFLYPVSWRRWKSFINLFCDIHYNFFFSPASLATLSRQTGGLELDLQSGAANVTRWHTIPVHPVLMAGSAAIDILSSVVGRAYECLPTLGRRVPSLRAPRLDRRLLCVKRS